MRRTAGAPYERFDLDSGHTDALAGISATDEIALALTDGRFVITSAGAVAVYSLDTGANDLLAIEDHRRIVRLSIGSSKRELVVPAP